MDFFLKTGRMFHRSAFVGWRVIPGNIKHKTARKGLGFSPLFPECQMGLIMEKNEIKNEIPKSVHCNKSIINQTML